MDVQRDITGDVCCGISGDVGVLRTAIDGLYAIGAAWHVKGDGFTSSLVATAIELVDGTGRTGWRCGKLQTGFAVYHTHHVGAAEYVAYQTTVEVEAVVAIDVGTRVACAGTVAAAEHVIDQATVDGHIGSGHISSIATAIDIFNGIVAVMDIDVGFGTGKRIICCQVATAIYLINGVCVIVKVAVGQFGRYRVGVAICRGVCRAIDIHIDIAFGCSCQVVPTKYATVDVHVIRVACSIAIADVDLHIAVNEGLRDIAIGIEIAVAIGFRIAQTAAVNVTRDGAVEVVDGGGGSDAG